MDQADAVAGYGVWIEHSKRLRHLKVIDSCFDFSELFSKVSQMSTTLARTTYRAMRPCFCNEVQIPIFIR